MTKVSQMVVWTSNNHGASWDYAGLGAHGERVATLRLLRGDAQEVTRESLARVFDAMPTDKEMDAWFEATASTLQPRNRY